MSSKSLSFELCNQKNFVWINSYADKYPTGDKTHQFHKSQFFSLVSYLNGQEVAQMIEIFQTHGLYHYIYIRHIDSDVEHYHILLAFKNAYICRNVISTVNLCHQVYYNERFRTVNTLCEYFDKGSNIVQYIFHQTEKAIQDNKTKYAWEECISDDIDYWKNFSLVSSTKNIDSLFLDMSKGMSMLDLASKYGRDFVLNYEKYMDFYLKFIKSDLVDIENNEIF